VLTPVCQRNKSSDIFDILKFYYKPNWGRLTLSIIAVNLLPNNLAQAYYNSKPNLWSAATWNAKKYFKTFSIKKMLQLSHKLIIMSQSYQTFCTLLT
jgi:hypothetical protein